MPPPHSHSQKRATTSLRERQKRTLPVSLTHAYPQTEGHAIPLKKAPFCPIANLFSHTVHTYPYPWTEREREAQTSVWPFSAAKYKGVRLSLSTAFTSAPNWDSAAITCEKVRGREAKERERERNGERERRRERGNASELACADVCGQQGEGVCALWAKWGHTKHILFAAAHRECVNG